MEIFSFVIDINLIQIIILILGIIMVIIEMLHPGFGVPGIIGGLLILVGIFLAAKTFIQAVILFTIAFIILLISFFLVLRSVTSGKLSKKLILHYFQQKESTFDTIENLEIFYEKEGITVTVLRPCGIAEFENVKINVVSDGNFIDQGKKIKVIKVEGSKVVVREI